MHPVQVPNQKADDGKILSKDPAAIKKKIEEVKLIKAKLSEEQMQHLCEITIKFLKSKLNSSNFGGVAGASLENVQKLNIACQLVSIIDFAAPQTDIVKEVPTKHPKKILEETKKQKQLTVYNRVYVQNQSEEAVGMASCHFLANKGGSGESSYISYENAPSYWTLKDG